MLPLLPTFPQTAPVRDLQRSYRSLVDAVKKSHQPLVLINNSVPEAVLLDIETYKALVEDDYEWDYDRTKKLVDKAMASHFAGKSKRLASFDELGK